jgi:hypothetical protein
MTTTETPVPVAPFKQPAAEADVEKLPDHSGQRRPFPKEFFAPPPPQIGNVISADSDLRQGKNGLPVVVRWLIILAVSGGVFAAFYWFASIQEKRTDRNLIQSWGYILTVLAFVAAWFLTRFRKTCTYVGDAGVVRYTLKGSQNSTPHVDLLVFNDAAEVHASQTRQYLNGVYTGTSYDYYWTDASGRRVLRVKGTYRANNKPPKQGHPFHFAHAAETAWSEHFLRRAEQQLKSEGSIAFRVDKRGRIVRVGPGFLEFHFGGDGPQRFTAEDIASVGLGGGYFSFKHKDAKWYSRQGNYNFSYGSMANAKVFLFALNRLMGYRWE